MGTYRRLQRCIVEVLVRRGSRLGLAQIIGFAMKCMTVESCCRCYGKKCRFTTCGVGRIIEVRVGNRQSHLSQSTGCC
jgi:hypothetical protein